MDHLVHKHKSAIRKRYGLKTKKNRIIKKYLYRFLTDTLRESMIESIEQILTTPPGEWRDAPSFGESVSNLEQTCYDDSNNKQEDNTCLEQKPLP
jgi:hypothetical protein